MQSEQATEKLEKKIGRKLKVKEFKSRNKITEGNELKKGSKTKKTRKKDKPNHDSIQIYKYWKL